MPFAPINKVQQEQMQQQQGGNSVNISGGKGAAFDVVPGQEKKQAKSGQYANLQSYLQANQPQAQAMGQKLVSEVSNQGAEAQSKIGQLAQAKPNVEAYDPSAVIANAPTLSESQKQQYKTMKETGGYTGPQSQEQVSGYKEAQAAAQKASDAAKMAATEQGQQELLKKAYARPNYSGGQNKLDQVLLMGNQQATGKLSDLSKKYSDLYNQFNTTAQDVGLGINQAQQQALANKEAIAQAEPNAWNALLNPISQRATEMNKSNQDLISRVLNDVSDSALKEETMQKLGLNDGQRLYDLNLSNYINPNYSQAGLNEAASSEERAKYKALAELFGDQSRTEIGQADASINPLAFNQEQFLKDLGQKNQEFSNISKNQMLSAYAQKADPNIYGNPYWASSANMSVADILGLNPNFSPNLTPDMLNLNFTDSSTFNPDTAYFNEPTSTEPTGVYEGVTGGIKGGLPSSDITTRAEQYQQEAQAGVRNQIYDQLLNFLNSQNYNRQVSKES